MGRPPKFNADVFEPTPLEIRLLQSYRRMRPHSQRTALGFVEQSAKEYQQERAQSKPVLRLVKGGAS